MNIRTVFRSAHQKKTDLGQKRHIYFAGSAEVPDYIFSKPFPLFLSSFLYSTSSFPADPKHFSENIIYVHHNIRNKPNQSLPTSFFLHYTIINLTHVVMFIEIFKFIFSGRLFVLSSTHIKAFFCPQRTRLPAYVKNAEFPDLHSRGNRGAFRKNKGRSQNSDSSLCFPHLSIRFAFE